MPFMMGPTTHPARVVVFGNVYIGNCNIGGICTRFWNKAMISIP